MKKIILAIALAIISMSAFAQDILVKRDGMTIKAKVEKVTESNVQYKKYNDSSKKVLTINIADLLAINYENGETVTFNSKGESHTTNNSLLNEGDRKLTDAQLIALSRGEKRELTPQEKLYRKGKRLKTAGWVVGGTLIAGGIAVAVLGFTDALGFDEERDHYHGGRYVWEDACACSEYGLLIGVSAIAVGAGTGYLLIRNGNGKIKQSQSISSASLLQYELPLGNNSSMVADLNLMKDNITKQYAPGIGFHINF